MTAKCALCQLLLEGKTINVKNCFTLIGLTNAAREVSRMVEQPFDVTVKRIERNGKSRYDQPVNWIDYKLEKTEANKEGIERMKKYIEKNFGEAKVGNADKVTVNQYQRSMPKAPKTIIEDKQQKLL